MSELFPQHTVITVDEEDFRIYRGTAGKQSRFYARPEVHDVGQVTSCAQAFAGILFHQPLRACGPKL